MHNFKVFEGGLAPETRVAGLPGRIPVPAPTAAVFAKIFREQVEKGYLENPTSGSYQSAQVRPGMSSPTREEFDAKAEAAEARTQVLLAKIDGKVDRIADAVVRLESDVSASRSEARQESSNLRLWLISTGIAIFLGIAAIMVGMLAYGISSIQLGISAAPPQITVVPAFNLPALEKDDLASEEEGQEVK